MNAKNIGSRSGFLAAVPALCLVHGSAIAQSAPPSDSQSATLEQVIVTAERREASMQEIPLAISAMTGDALAERGISNIEALNFAIPNLNFSRYGGIAQVSVRGVSFDASSPGAEARTAVYRDGIYFSRPSLALASFFDVDRVEVLRGPQGTLYGRNATGGAVNIISRRPSRELDGYARVTVGSNALFGLEGAVGGPFSESLSGRVSFYSSDRDGFGKNLNTGEDVDDEHTRSVRGQLLLEPNDALSARLWGQYDRRNDASGGHKIFGRGIVGMPTSDELIGSTQTNPRDTVGMQPINQQDSYSAGLDLEYRLDDNLTLVSQTGYIDSQTVLRFGVASFDQLRPEYTHEITQEIRLQGEYDSVSFVTGGYYFTEHVNGSVWTPLRLAAINAGNTIYGSDVGGELDTEAYAVFGQADWRFAEQWTLTLGGRYSTEEKRIHEYAGLLLTPFPFGSFNGPRVSFPYVSDSERWSSFTPKATLTYQPVDDVMGYVTYSKGFKSGGFTLGGLTPAFAPEKLTNIEAGVKAEFFDNRLRTNLAVFQYDYEELQVQKYVNNLVRVENAAGSTIRGLEAELRGRAFDFDLGVSVALLDAKFDDFLTQDPNFLNLGLLQLEGNDLAQAPRYTVSADAAYEIPLMNGDLQLRADVTWKERTWFSAYNKDTASQPSYAVANASVAYEWGEGWSASAFVHNLTDEQYRLTSIIGPNLLGGILGGNLGAPRTYGVVLSKRF